MNVPEHIPEYQQTREFFEQKYGKSGLGVLSTADWHRMFQAYSFVIPGVVADIGVGNGALLHILSRSSRCSEITGVDIRRHSMLQLPDNCTFKEQSVCQLEMADGHFDTVVCMEVLEHLEVPDFPDALRQLRRVTKQRLIVTIPYNEPEPVWWHDRPGGHRQSFDDDKIAALFPDFVGALIERPKSTDWLLLVHDKQRLRESHRILPMRDLQMLMGVDDQLLVGPD